MAKNPNKTVPPGKRSLAARTDKPSGALDSKLSPDQGPDIEQQMAALDTVGLRNKMRARDAAQATDTKSVGDTLLGTESLIKLGLAAAAAGFGGEAGQGIGMALAGGTLRGAQQNTDQYNQDRQKQINDLSSMVDKQQQRLVTLLQSQPGLFLDDQGQNLVKEGEWAELLELGVPINVQGLVRAATMTKGSKEMTAQAWKWIKEGRDNNNPEWVKRGIQQLAAANPHMNLDAEAQAALYSMTDLNAWATLNQTFTSESVGQAMKYSVETGIDLVSEEIFDMLMPKPKGGLADTPAGIKLAKFTEAQFELQKYINNGHQQEWNDDTHQTIKDAFRGLENESTLYADLLDGSPYYSLGEDRDIMRMKAVQQAFATMQANLIEFSGLTGGDLLEAMQVAVKQQKQIENQAIGIQENASSMQTARYLGTAFINQNPGIPEEMAGEVGLRLLSLQRQWVAEHLPPGSTWNDYKQEDQALIMHYLVELEAATYWDSNPERKAALEGLKEKAGETSVYDASVAADIKKDVVVVSTPAGAFQVEQLAGEDSALRRMSHKARYQKSNVNITPEQEADIIIFDEWAARPADERLALSSDPDIARAIGTVQALAGASMTPQEVTAIMADEEKNLKLLKKLRKEKNLVQRDALARKTPKYVAALKWEQEHLLVPEDVRAAERKRVLKAEPSRSYGKE